MIKIKTKEETKKQDRYVYIDIARVFAILCVILCHSVENVYNPK